LPLGASFRVVLLLAATFAVATPGVADAQDFVYVLEDSPDIMGSTCHLVPTPSSCLSRLLTVDLQDLKILRTERLPERTNGWLGQSVDGSTLLWHLEDHAYRAFDRVTLTSRTLTSAEAISAYGLRALQHGGMAVTADGATAYVTTDTGLNIVSVASGTVTATITLPGDGPGVVAVAPDGMTVFAVRWTYASEPPLIFRNTLFRIDAASRSVTASRDLALLYGNSLAVSADSLSVWMTDSDWYSNVWRFRADTLEEIAQVTNAKRIYSLTLSRDGSKLLVTTQNSLDIIDTATSNVTATAPLASGEWRGTVALPSGAPCVFRVSPSTINAPVTGGSFSINLPAQAGCTRNATTSAGWVQHLSPQLGSGPATVTFTLSYNAEAAARSTTLVIAGQEVVVTQAAAPIPPGTPSAPVNFDVQLAPGGAVTVSWQPPASGPTPATYLIEVGTVTGDRDLLIANVGLQTSVSACCLPAATVFARARAVNAAGGGPPSNEIAVNPVLPLTALTDVRMSWTSPSEGRLSWSEAVYSAVGFRIELRARSNDATIGTLDVAGHQVRLPRSLLPRGSYYAIVRGIDASGNLGPPPSSWGLIETGDCRSAPPTPTLTVAVTGGLVSIALAIDVWYPYPPFDAFRLYAGRSPGGSDVGTFDLVTPQVSVAAPAGSYYVRAAAVNPCGVSQASSEQTIAVP
jgi:hypothetical protein